MAIYDMYESAQIQTHMNWNWWVRQAATGGVVAGLIFALFEMVAAAALTGANALFTPLRMVVAIARGPQVLAPDYPLTVIVLGGLSLHLMIAAVYGVIFSILAAALRLARPSLALLAAASLYGLLLWLVNFYLIAPLAFPWFTQTDPIVQCVAHTIFFGAALGLYLNQISASIRRAARRRAIEQPSAAALRREA
jgi:hypothetical protein